MSFLDNASVLITGGTGSFGRALTRRLIHSKARRIAIFSREEHKQFKMKNEFHDDLLRFFLGDIRDRLRLDIAPHNVDYVVRTAALKQIDTRGPIGDLQLILGKRFKKDLNPGEAATIDYVE